MSRPLQLRKLDKTRIVDAETSTKPPPEVALTPRPPLNEMLHA